MTTNNDIFLTWELAKSAFFLSRLNLSRCELAEKVWKTRNYAAVVAKYEQIIGLTIVSAKEESSKVLPPNDLIS